MSASSLAEPLPAAAPLTTERLDAPRWSLATRVAFRFVFCFLGLLYFPFPLDLSESIAGAWTNVLETVADAVGPALFGLSVDATFNGSGDKAFNWVILFVIAVTAAAATLVWSILDRRALSYPRLHAWFRVYIRFALAVAMISYGTFKVIPSQFVAPSLDRLIQPFGSASPMGLLWTFMGASVPYTIFTGLGEMAGGLLLTVRRTTLLGALISAAVMTHVVMLNFAYDVPVKIYSSQLLLTALVLLAPDARRLAGFFLNQPDQPLIGRPRLRIAARVVIALAVLGVTGWSLMQSWEQRNLIRARRAPFSLSGVWNVDELSVDGVQQPPLTTDTTRWRRLVFAGKEAAAIQDMSGANTRFQLVLDEKKGTLTLKKRFDPKFEAVTFSYQRLDANTLAIDGTFEGKRMVAKLRKGSDREFLLTTRGFHWINETPFNR